MIKQRLVMATVAAILAALLSSSSYAQPGGRGGFGGRGGGGLMGLLRIEAVQKELEMLDDQIAAVEKLGEKLQQDFPRPEMGNFREMSDADREKAMAQFQERSQKMEKAAEKELAEILLPPQIDRLKEIVIQQMGVSALGNAEVAGKLKLSDARQAKIKSVLEENRSQMREKMTALFQSGDRENMREKMESLRKESDEKVLAVLTADQKKQFEELKGEPFEMPRSQFGGRGGQGRGGQGQGRGGQGRGGQGRGGQGRGGQGGGGQGRGGQGGGGQGRGGQGTGTRPQ